MPEHVLILGVLVGVPLAALAAALLGLLTRPFGRGWRLALRILSVPLVLLCFLKALLFGASFAETGRWMCFVCRAVERRTEYVGVPVYRTGDVDGEVGVTAAREFEAWYWERIGREHEHAWTRMGCHGKGLGTVMCAPTYEEEPLYVCLRRIPDRKVFWHMVTRWIDASAEDRYKLIQDFWDLERPFAELYDQEDISTQDPLHEHVAGGGAALRRQQHVAPGYADLPGLRNRQDALALT